MSNDESKKSEAETYWRESVGFSFKYDQEKAMEYINKALELIPSSEKYVIEKAEILCEQGKCKDALKFLSQHGSAANEDIKKEIEKIEGAVKYDEAKPQENLVKLIEWGEKNGVDTRNIKVVYYSPDFRGIHAARRIKQNDRIITVPMKSFLNLEIILGSCPLAKKVSECGVNLEYPFPTALACLVYEMKGKVGQYWQPYADSFPETADTFPYFFTDEEKKYLEGTINENKMEGEIQQSSEEYDKICENVPEMKGMTKKGYLMLTTLACSRHFSVPDFVGNEMAVPIVDMFNYYPEKYGQTYWQYFPKEKVFAVTAQKDIAWGEVIGLNYGFKPNRRYLQYYGFIPENNEYMTVCIELQMNKDDPLLKEKQKLLEYNNDEMYIYGKNFYFDWDTYYYKNEKAMSACRFAAFKGDIKDIEKKLMIYPEGTRYKKIRIDPISIENEKAALEILKKFAETSLKRYPKSLAEDEKILKDQKKLSMNSINALTVRVGEERAYTNIIEFADKMIALFNSKEKPENEVDEMPDDLWYKSYAIYVLLPLFNLQ